MKFIHYISIWFNFIYLFITYFFSLYLITLFKPYLNLNFIKILFITYIWEEWELTVWLMDWIRCVLHCTKLNSSWDSTLREDWTVQNKVQIPPIHLLYIALRNPRAIRGALHVRFPSPLVKSREDHILTFYLFIIYIINIRMSKYIFLV